MAFRDLSSAQNLYILCGGSVTIINEDDARSILSCNDYESKSLTRVLDTPELVEPRISASFRPDRLMEAGFTKQCGLAPIR